MEITEKERKYTFELILTETEFNDLTAATNIVFADNANNEKKLKALVPIFELKDRLVLVKESGNTNGNQEKEYGDYDPCGYVIS